MKLASLLLVITLLFASVIPPVPYTGKTSREIITLDNYHDFQRVVVPSHTPITVTQQILDNLCFAEWYTKDEVNPILHGGLVPCNAVLPYVKG